MDNSRGRINICPLMGKDNCLHIFILGVEFNCDFFFNYVFVISLAPPHSIYSLEKSLYLLEYFFVAVWLWKSSLGLPLSYDPMNVRIQVELRVFCPVFQYLRVWNDLLFVEAGIFFFCWFPWRGIAWWICRFRGTFKCGVKRLLWNGRFRWRGFLYLYGIGGFSMEICRLMHAGMILFCSFLLLHWARTCSFNPHLKHCFLHSIFIFNKSFLSTTNMFRIYLVVLYTELLW